MRLEIKFHRATARHADVALQRPTHETWTQLIAVRRSKHLLSKRDCLSLDTSAADRAGVKSGRGDQHFCSGMLGGAAECVDEDNGDKWRACGFERNKLVVKRRKSGRWKIGEHQR